MQRKWPVVLEVEGQQVNEKIIEQKYRVLAKTRHPDAGGSNEAMTELNLARDSALQWVATERKRAILAERQAEAAKIAALHAETVFRQVYQQQMNASQNYANQQQWVNSMMGGIGSMGASTNAGFVNAAANAPIEEEKRKSKWERVREILRGER